MEKKAPQKAVKKAPKKAKAEKTEAAEPAK
jgi:hypothetical protein